MPSEVSGSASRSASSSCTKKPPRPPAPPKSPDDDALEHRLRRRRRRPRPVALEGVDRVSPAVTAGAEGDRRRRARVVGARRDAPQEEVRVVLVGVGAAAREALADGGRVLEPEPGALGVRRARVALVAERVHERRPVAQPGAVGRAVLRPVGVGLDVLVAVRRVRRVRADDVEVARREGRRPGARPSGRSRRRRRCR